MITVEGLQLAATIVTRSIAVVVLLVMGGGIVCAIRELLRAEVGVDDE